ncbi:hypothetical protein [Streptomyces sp. NPDC002564]|uniref:hypothetical protein n=1 Tax=Streptomyces sp. NPDC002564 TaxID=3364649 RepID=UPI0036891C50
MSERDKRDEQGGFKHHGRNGNVNHGPEDARGPDGGPDGSGAGPARPGAEARPDPADGSRPAGEPDAPDTSDAPDTAQVKDPLDRLRAAAGLRSVDGPGRGPEAERDAAEPAAEPAADELALRRLLHEAVQEIEPDDRALDHLRKAVPARRARKRQAVVGLAAAALFIGTAVPALVHVTNSSGDADDRTSIAGNSQEAQGGSSQGKDPEGGKKGSGEKPDRSKDKDHKDKKDKKDGKEKGGTGGGGTGSPDPSTSEAASSPVCDAAQLGATGSAGTPEADNKVYGSFRVSNISDSSCTVEAAGAVGAVAQGAADAAKVGVVDHTSGDQATGLPDPSQEASPLVLQPGASYEVRFAWVPSESCPSDGGEPSPNPTPSEGGSGATEGGTPDGTTTQLGRTDGGTADGSVAISLTAEAGAPSASTTIGNACAGTVYRTGVLPAS